MQKFLRLLNQGQLPADLTKRFALKVGEDVFGILKKEGIIKKGEPARWYPGPLDDPSHLRRIVINHGDKQYPYVAIADDEELIASVRLKPKDIEQHYTSLPDLLKTIQSLFGITGILNLKRCLFLHTYSLGEDHLKRNVVYCGAPSEEGFGAFLNSRKLAKHPTVVLSPARSRWMESGLEELFAENDKVELLFLEDVLRIVDNKLELVLDRPRKPLEAKRNLKKTKQVFCRFFGVDGFEEISFEQYRALEQSSKDYALFLNMMTAGKNGRYTGHVINDQKECIKVNLTAHESNVLLELLTRKVALRPNELHCIAEASILNPVKTVESMRRKMDVKYGRGNWRSIHTLPSDNPGAKRFVFNPPSDLKWAILAPMVF